MCSKLVMLLMLGLHRKICTGQALMSYVLSQGNRNLSFPELVLVEHHRNVQEVLLHLIALSNHVYAEALINE